jgi:hypothetical protein
MSKLSLKLSNGDCIQDSDANFWFEACQYAVDYGNMELAEVFHSKAQELVKLFVSVKSSIEENKRKNYCDICSHHKDNHVKTGDKLPENYYGDNKEYDEWSCDGEELDSFYHGGCDCDDMVLLDEIK